MSKVWYCATCGYEVNRGGRCHNCREVLIESPLDELAEGEVADEVGYRLDDWEDATRAELIELLIDNEVRHRFEGDELVVADEDEELVDGLVAGVTGVPNGEVSLADGGARLAGPLDRVVLGLVETLLSAARRLAEDPTDMAADADVAEVSGALFDVGAPAGIDAETWAAVERVTRRLLGALGADVALEAEISTEAQVLCRLLEPVVAQVPASAPDVAARDGDADTDTEGDGEDVDDDRHEVVYDLSDWLVEERARLGLILDREAIPYSWEGTDIVVAERDWDRVDELCAEVVPPEGDDDDAGEERYRALSELFGAADRLAGDPDDKVKRGAAGDAAEVVTSGPMPIGLSDDQWWQVRARVKSLCDALDEDLPAGEVRATAASVADFLRGFV